MRTITRLRGDSLLAAEMSKLGSRVWKYCRKHDIKVVLIGSPTRGEGKSTTTAYLATAMGEFSGRKILAADFDFRIPSLNREFDVEVRNGVDRALEGKVPFSKVIAHTALPSLDVAVLAGKSNPDLLHETDRVRDCLAYARENYDLVLLDTPALIPVADAATLIPFVDAVIIVAMAGKTTEPQLRQAVNICRGLDAEILGLVLNNIHEAAPDQVLDEYNYYYD